MLAPWKAGEADAGCVDGVRDLNVTNPRRRKDTRGAVSGTLGEVDSRESAR